IVLQAYGWQRGWALWSEIAALSQLVHHGATSISDKVASGDVAVGLSIDFFVKAAMANGSQVSQRYPLHNGINPAHVAVFKSAGNPAGARAFAEFVLSPPGQSLLLQRDIRKLPVRPQTYQGAGPDEFNPFKAEAHGTMTYDGERGLGRLNVISAVFDAMLAHP